MMMQTPLSLNSIDSYKGKSVLITGHTGFKGSWLASWLIQLGANVTGIALNPPTHPSHFEELNLAGQLEDLRLDIRNQVDLESEVLRIKPDFVFHQAAQSLVRKSYEDPIETWQVNLMGTLNVLEALRKLDKNCAAVLITSDKCYENVEWIWGYRETDVLGGADPYSASKAASELAIRSHIKSYFPMESSKIRIASARAGNVIGGGDWARDRIIPDCIRSWTDQETVNLRNPHATRPWQHVLEPLSGYLILGLKLMSNRETHGESFNFGPLTNESRSVLELVREMSKYWSQVKWNEDLTVEDSVQEAGLLKLNCEKAQHHLSWHSTLNFSDTVRMTSAWYKSYYENSGNILEKTNEQILEFTRIAQLQGLKWAN
jgi:CDP-glucose 4,6-dehydratase